MYLAYWLLAACERRCTASFLHLEVLVGVFDWADIQTMRGFRTRLLLHQRRDRGGNAHNFPFDTLTKVYRDSVYAPQQRYQGNPMHPDLHSSDSSQQVGSSRVSRSPSGATAATSAKMEDISSAAMPMAGDDEAMRQRLRASLLKKSQRRPIAAEVEATEDRGSPTAATATVAPLQLSGVQREIIGVFRAMLREVRRMKDPSTRIALQSYIRSEFDRQRAVSRQHIMKIEWHLHYGKRKLEDLQAMDADTKFSVKK